MTIYQASRRDAHRRWEIWAAFVLGLLFLGLGVPLARQYEAHQQAAETVEAEREAEQNG